MAKLNKERFKTGNDRSGFSIDVGLEFHKIIDYDRKVMRKALAGGGRDVIKEARRIVSRRAISAPGGIPGEVSGALKRSIGVVTKGSKGGWIKVGPRRTKEMEAKASKSKWAFYPAFLFYGSAKRHLAKRANFMTDALQNKREAVRSVIRAALKESLVPR
jgi:hypothetical protein